VSVKSGVDQPSDDASFVVSRRVGAALDMSPLNEGGESANQVNTIDAEHEALLELRRKVRIEVAFTPAEWSVQGWEFEPVFEGFIDNVEIEADTVSVDCVDKMAILSDLFQLDPRFYDYYQSNTLAEVHMQAVISNNAPCAKIGSATVSFSYLGGYTPMLYTPATSNWLLRFDDTPAANVDSTIRTVADQIGWDLRYRWHEPTQEFRLSFYEPPRDLTLTILDSTLDDDGYLNLTTSRPHLLTPEQTVTFQAPYPAAAISDGLVLDLDASVQTNFRDTTSDPWGTLGAGNTFGIWGNNGSVAADQASGLDAVWTADVLNGHGVVTIDGATNGALTAYTENPFDPDYIDEYIQNDEWTMIVVHKPTAVISGSKSTGRIAYNGNIGTLAGIIDDGGSQVYTGNYDGNADYSGYVPCALSTWHITTFRHQDGEIQCIDNGTEATATATGNTSLLSGSIEFFRSYTGQVARLLMWNRKLTDDEYASMIGYAEETYDLAGVSGPVSTTVAEVTAANKVKTFATSDTSATSLTYGVHYTFPDTLVRAYDPVKKSAQDIRNVCVVKYQRDGSTATLGATFVGTATDPATIR
jgi:hypothetical protein